LDFNLEQQSKTQKSSLSSY